MSCQVDLHRRIACACRDCDWTYYAHGDARYMPMVTARNAARRHVNEHHHRVSVEFTRINTYQPEETAWSPSSASTA